jgi:hypothetical protein
MRRPSQSGTSIIELVIYIGLLSLMIAGILGAGYQFIESSGDIQSKITVDEEANFLLRKMNWVLNGVSTVHMPAPGAAASTLSVDKAGYPDNPIVFDLQSSMVRIAEGSGAPVDLNGRAVAVENLSFSFLGGTGGEPSAISAHFSIGDRVFDLTRYLEL